VLTCGHAPGDQQRARHDSSPQSQQIHAPHTVSVKVRYESDQLPQQVSRHTGAVLAAPHLRKNGVSQSRVNKQSHEGRARAVTYLSDQHRKLVREVHLAGITTIRLTHQAECVRLALPETNTPQHHHSRAQHTTPHQTRPDQTNTSPSFITLSMPEQNRHRHGPWSEQ